MPINLANVATVVRNAAVLELFGAELELMFQINENWFVRASYGYIDAEYDEYFADLNGDGIVTDNSDLTSRRTPENTFGFTTNYTLDLGPGQLSTQVSYRWIDEQETVADNSRGQLDSIEDLSATVSYVWGEDGRYRASLFGRNITDERQAAGPFIGGLTNAVAWNEPANYGLQFSLSL